MTTRMQEMGAGSGSVPMKVIAVTSGKGGVGKTSVAVNLAISMAKLGRRVILFDADLSLANVDVALGLRPRFDISHVLDGEKSLEDVMLEGPSGVRIIPAASGIGALSRLSEQQQAGLISAFSEMSVPVDTLVVDTAAGLDSSVLRFSSACQDIIVVVCDEPTSITDAYAMIKVLNQDCGVKSFNLLSNMVENEAHGKNLFAKMDKVVGRFLDVKLSYLGAVPRDHQMRRAIREQVAVSHTYPFCMSARAITRLAEKIGGEPIGESAVSGLGFFFERIVDSGVGAELST
ncbi:MinD/ParA family protein [Pseudohalioglobus lutimaris]|nr:MinD/ParA family protein [Pseudohalioglobus lutimaris]